MSFQVKQRFWKTLLVILGLGVFWIHPVRGQAAGPVLLVQLDDAITPASAAMLINSLREARRQGFQAVIWEIDTPGGLVESTRKIVKAMLASPVPIIVYVAPPGARAASAGTFLVLAAHVAAMAPGTHLGAAHPITLIGGKPDPKTLQKIENDLVAWAKSLAHLRGRNEKFAEAAVRESQTLTAEEALRQRVVDLLADNLNELLRKLNGRRVRMENRVVVLRTRNISVVVYREGLKSRILRLLAHPQIAYFLLMLGLAGLYFELSHPGAVFPGVLGAICLVLALFALQILPVNYAGLLLIFLAAVLYFLEIKVTSYGLLTLAATISLFLGSLMLFGKNPQGLRLPYGFLIPVTSAISLFFLTITWLAARALRRKPFSGREGLLGKEGRCLTEVGPSGGQIFLEGEIWQAVADEPIPAGSPVKVVAQKGLKVRVSPLRDEPSEGT